MNVQSLQGFPCNLILFFADGVVKRKFGLAAWIFLLSSRELFGLWREKREIFADFFPSCNSRRFAYIDKTMREYDWHGSVILCTYVFFFFFSYDFSVLKTVCPGDAYLRKEREKRIESEDRKLIVKRLSGRVICIIAHAVVAANHRISLRAGS